MGIFKRASTQHVDVDVQITEMAPERQFIDTKKWRYYISVLFNRELPAITPDQFGALNELTLMAETDRVFIGYHFVEIRTDNPERYNAHEVAVATCKCFGFQLGQLHALIPHSGPRS